MARRIVRKQIPWIMKSSKLLSSWKWDTPHFSASVLAEGISDKKMYTWKILDKSSGQPVPFESNVVSGFDKAVEEILEIIGKAYDRTLGYQDYAGELATTFQVFDGRKIDFANAIGRTVTMVVKNSEDELDDLILSGQLDVDHYDIVLYSGDGDGMLTRVPPSYIKVINDEFSVSNLLDSLEVNGTLSKTGRMFEGPWTKGCTGKPNITNTSVMHGPNATYCPIHGV